MMPKPAITHRLMREIRSGVFPKWNENSVNATNSGTLTNHYSMNQGQFKDSVSHMCLAGTVVASWSLTQVMAGPSSFTVMTNIFSLNSAN